MKKISAIRALSLISAALFLSAALTSCTKKDKDKDGTLNTGSDKEAYTLSLGVVLTADKSTEGTAKAEATVAAVLCDKNSKIVDCVVDCMENKMVISDGVLQTGNEYLTKGERNDSYGMAPHSGIGREWYEQAEFFADHVKGMSEDEVSGIGVDDGGKATDADLSAGCTISVSDMKKAVVKAMQADADKRASVASDKPPEVSLSVITDDSASKSATQNSSGSAVMKSVFCALAVTDGRIDGAVIDEAEPEIAFDKTGKPGDAAYDGTKLEQGGDYGMLSASKLGKEWYEQSRFLCEYISGMSADEVAAIAVGSDGKAEDADLAAGCTVAVNKYIQAVIKALK